MQVSRRTRPLGDGAGMRGCGDAGKRKVYEPIDVDAPTWPLFLQESSDTDVPVAVLPAADAARSGNAGAGEEVFGPMLVAAVQASALAKPYHQAVVCSTVQR